jgi:hypothetical protein
MLKTPLSRNHAVYYIYGGYRQEVTSGKKKWVLDLSLSA